jgi:hypothetical protein
MTAAALAYIKAGDPDLGFHLATGRAVMSLGHVPATNVLSYTQPNQPWLLHQWAPAVLFEWIRLRFGIPGIGVLKMAVIAATWLAVLRATENALTDGRRKDGDSMVVSAIVVVGFAAAASFRFVERPFIFSNLAMACVCWGLTAALPSLETRSSREHAARGERESERANARVVRPLTIAALASVMACHLHAGGLNAMGLLVAGFFGVWLEPVRARLARSTMAGAGGWRAAWPIGVAAIAAIVAVAVTIPMVNPNGLRVLTFAFTTASDYRRMHVPEARAPWAFSAALLASFWVVATASIVWMTWRVRRTHLLWSGVFALFGLLAFRHVRLIYDFAVVAPVAVGASLRTPLGEWLDGRGVGSRRPAIGAFVLIAAAAIGHQWWRLPRGLGTTEEMWPRTLFGVMEREGLRGPSFVSDRWAGAYLAERYPSERSFFDMRLDAYSPEFEREVYQRIRYGESGWRALLDRYGVELVLLSYTTPGEKELRGAAPNLRQRLASDPDFRLVAFDDHGEVWVRGAGVNHAAAERLAIEGVEPDAGTFIGRPRLAWSSLERATTRGPRSARLLGLAAVAAADAGEVGRARSLLSELERIGDSEMTTRVRAFVESR